MERDIRELLGLTRSLLSAYRDAGFAPPPVSVERRRFLEHGPAASGAVAGPFETRESLETVREDLGECRRCGLCTGRTTLVFGEGNPRARLVFVGEGPGREEDRTGRPFVGEAGALLTGIIEKGMGLSRRDVYICNVVKCRPPGNRDPEGDEIAACLPFLKRQLAAIEPEIICVLGRIAGSALCGGDFRITRDRGVWRSFEGTPLMATYHPSYILRNPGRQRELKGQVWLDVQEIMKRLGLEVKRHG